jgi:hypothetical protein
LYNNDLNSINVGKGNVYSPTGAYASYGDGLRQLVNNIDFTKITVNSVLVNGLHYMRLARIADDLYEFTCVYADVAGVSIKCAQIYKNNSTSPRMIILKYDGTVQDITNNAVGDVAEGANFRFAMVY